MDLKKTQNWPFFPKVIVHDFGQKVEVFSSFVFIKNRWRDGEKVFADVLEKKALRTIRTSVDEKRKIRIFPKWLVHRFRQKLEISSTFILMRNRPRRSFWGRSS